MQDTFNGDKGEMKSESEWENADDFRIQHSFVYRTNELI